MMPEFNLAEAAAVLKELGYEGVEWRVHNAPSELSEKPDYWRANRATVDVETVVDKAAEVRKLTEDHGLEVMALGTYLSYKMLDDVERCMEAARIMGAGSIRVGPPKYDGSENYNDLIEEAYEGFACVEDLARQYKVRANVEIHPRNICSSASLAYRLVSSFDPDNIGVILDPGNMIIEGYENWQLGLELLGPYLSHVHVKNAAWFEESNSDGVKTWRGAVAPLKEGYVSWRDLLWILDRVGFKGWLSVEDFAAGDARTKLAEDIAYLRALEAELAI
jgi:sugar phosphate isomerase/epimerase